MCEATGTRDDVQYTVRRASRQDVKTIDMMCREEGWEIGLMLLQTIFDMDPRAWFVAEDDRGEIIGVRAFQHQADPTNPVTCGGVYIVKPQFRGLGVGRAVNTPAMRAAAEGTVIISATDINLYTKYGFIFDYSIHQKRVNVGHLQDAVTDTMKSTTNTFKLGQFSDAMLTGLIKYDSTVTQYERSEYVKKWILGKAEAVLVAHDDEGEVIGYGCLRRTEFGAQITPLYADSVTIATALLKSLLEKCDRAEHVDLSCPDGTVSMFNSLAAHPHQNLVTLHKMWKGPRIDVQRDRVFSMSFLSMSII